jgi:hypothetical protein
MAKKSNISENSSQLKDGVLFLSWWMMDLIRDKKFDKSMRIICTPFMIDSASLLIRVSNNTKINKKVSK